MCSADRHPVGSNLIAVLVSRVNWPVVHRSQFDEQMGPLKSTLIKFAATNYRSGRLGNLSAPLSTEVRYRGVRQHLLLVISATTESRKRP